MKTPYEYPRIEVVLVPNGEDDGRTIISLFDVRFTLHLPDGKGVEAFLAEGGPFSRTDAAKKIGDVWVAMGEDFKDLAVVLQGVLRITEACC